MHDFFIYIEKVQKRATKLVINLKKIPYTNRLQRLKLPNIEIYKIAWRYDRSI